MGIFIPNVMFLCVTLWLGRVYTDNDTNTDDAGRRRIKHDCIWLFGPSSCGQESTFKGENIVFPLVNQKTIQINMSCTI